MNAGRLDMHLEHSASLPRGLVAHARQLIELNRALKSWLAPWGAWTQHISLANFRSPSATLFVATAAVATPLRYRQQEILAWLGEQTGERFTRLEVSVRALPGQRSPGV